MNLESDFLELNLFKTILTESINEHERNLVRFQKFSLKKQKPIALLQEIFSVLQKRKFFSFTKKKFFQFYKKENFTLLQEIFSVLKKKNFQF